MIKMKFPTSGEREEAEPLEPSLDELQSILEMTDEEFRKFLQDYGFAEG